MRITEVKSYIVYAEWRNWIFVKVETDQGIHGVGEATLEGKEHAVTGAIRDLSYYLEGKDPREIELHLRNMYRDPFWRGGVVLNTAISAIEIALWDILGKHLGQPVYRLLGGKLRDRVRAYANGWYFGASEPGEYAELAREVVARGYTALKWDPFRRSDLEVSREDLEFAVECIRKVREAMGPRVDLLIEGHGRFSPASALKIARAMEPYDIFWFEEPVPPENLQALTKVAGGTPISIATGERLYTKHDYRRLLPLQAAAYIQPDVIHAGGILELKKIAAMAEAWYVQVAPHNPNGPVAMAASLQAAACTPNIVLMEYLMADPPWRKQVVTFDPDIDAEGYLRIPDRPGLGVDLVEEELVKHPYQPKALNFFSEESVLERPIVPRQGQGA